MGAIAVLVFWAVLLTVVDLTVRRLPDALTLPPALSALGVSAMYDPSALVAGLVWPGLYLLTALLTRGIGGGDLKLAVPLGVLAGATAGLIGVLSAVALAGVLSSASAWRAGHTPHGPAMLLACAAICGIALWPWRA